MVLSDEDTEYLKQRLEKALDKKMLNSKTCVVYDPATEEIQEIKGLVYHKTADGKILSNVIDKKSSGMTFRKKSVSSAAAAAASPAAAAAASLAPAQESSQ
jgi:hypothetical protein